MEGQGAFTLDASRLTLAASRFTLCQDSHCMRYHHSQSGMHHGSYWLRRVFSVKRGVPAPVDGGSVTIHTRASWFTLHHVSHCGITIHTARRGSHWLRRVLCVKRSVLAPVDGAASLRSGEARHCVAPGKLTQRVLSCTSTGRVTHPSLTRSLTTQRPWASVRTQRVTHSL